MQNSNIIEDLIFKEECYTIIGMCITIHNKLGKGFKEVVYEDAMEIEFKKAGIFYAREKEFSIEYDGALLPHKFDADFLVFESIILK